MWFIFFSFNLSFFQFQVEDIDENHDKDKEEDNSDHSSNVEEHVCLDAVSTLLATFNTSTCKAIDSDEENDLVEEDVSDIRDKGNKTDEFTSKDVLEENDTDDEGNHADYEEDKVNDKQETIASDDAETSEDMQVCTHMHEPP